MLIITSLMIFLFQTGLAREEEVWLARMVDKEATHTLETEFKSEQMNAETESHTAQLPPEVRKTIGQKRLTRGAFWLVVKSAQLQKANQNSFILWPGASKVLLHQKRGGRVGFETMNNTYWAISMASLKGPFFKLSFDNYETLKVSHFFIGIFFSESTPKRPKSIKGNKLDY